MMKEVTQTLSKILEAIENEEVGSEKEAQHMANIAGLGHALWALMGGSVYGDGIARHINDCGETIDCAMAVIRQITENYGVPVLKNKGSN